MKTELLEIVIKDIERKAREIRAGLEAMGRAGFAEEAALTAAAIIEHVAHGDADKRPQLRTHGIQHPGKVVQIRPQEKK